MTIPQITQYLQKLETLVQMQQIELDKTRNLLGRVIDATEDKVITAERKEYRVPNEVCFDISVRTADVGIHAVILPTPFRTNYEQIIELKKELNL